MANAEDAQEDQEGAGIAEDFSIVHLAGNNHRFQSQLTTVELFTHRKLCKYGALDTCSTVRIHVLGI